MLLPQPSAGVRNMLRASPSVRTPIEHSPEFKASNCRNSKIHRISQELWILKPKARGSKPTTGGPANELACRATGSAIVSGASWYLSSSNRVDDDDDDDLTELVTASGQLRANLNHSNLIVNGRGGIIISRQFSQSKKLLIYDQWVLLLFKLDSLPIESNSNLLGLGNEWMQSWNE